MSLADQQADGQSKRHKCGHWWLKRWKARLTRRKAKQDLEYKPQSNRFTGGWET